MAKKLKNLEVTKVDFVDEGANQGANIKLFKRKDQNDNPVVAVPVQDPMKEQKSLFKRLMHSIGKSLGFNDEEIDSFSEPSADGNVQKGNSQTFGDKMTEVKRQKVADEIWSICYALQSSLQSILYDEDLEREKAKEMMEQSISEFDEIIAESVESWSNGKLCGIRKSLDDSELESMRKFRDKLDSDIQKAMEKQRGELEDMLKIDKSKMTAEERAAYDAIIKKYAVETEEEPVDKSKVKPGENEDEMEEEETEKGCGGGKKPTKKSASSEEGEDIYKGLHPLVAAEIQRLRKRADEAEERELMEVAKKYEIIGKKPEDLVPTLKSLKAAGGTAYNDMIGILDSAVSMAEAGGAFEEIGKSGHGRTGTPVAKSNSEAKIESIAKGYMEKDPNLNLTDAIAKAWENNMDLMAAYEEEAGI